MTKKARKQRFGSVTFDPLTGAIDTLSGQVMLRPQTAKVMAELVANAGTMVAKGDLLDRVWPDTYVTDDSLVQCISEIRKALNGVTDVTLRTIPKKGYQLDTEIAANNPADVPGGTRGLPRRAIAAAGIFIAALILAGSAFWLTRPDPVQRQITIAVMPFLNMSGDLSQSYFATGVAEDLIVSLSNISDLRMVSRGASFSLAQPDADIRDVAGSLQADYVLEGSVRRVGDTLRVSASLVDGSTGANVWADRYHGTPKDIFAFQDSVVDSLVRTLSVRLSAAERHRLGVHGTNSVAAHDAYLKGRELENLYSQETNLAAETALAQALRHDPQFALAHAHLAQVYSFRVENNWATDRAAIIAAAFDSANRAVALDPALPFAHFSLGRLYSRSFAPDETRAVQAYETAIRLDPNYDDAYVFLANIHIFNGRADQALPLISEGMQRNPLPPYWYHLAEGMAQFFLGNFQIAETALVRARDQNPNAPYPFRFLIATYGHLGDVDEAEWMAMEYEALGRTATVEALLASASVQDPAYRRAFASGFRAAGLPEN